MNSFRFGERVCLSVFKELAHYKIQVFLGFASFIRCCIGDCVFIFFLIACSLSFLQGDDAILKILTSLMFKSLFASVVFLCFTIIYNLSIATKLTSK